MKDEINKNIVGELFRIFRSLKDSLSFESKAGSLTMVQLEALIFLKNNKELQMKSFSDYFSTTMPTATSLIDKLISMGFATRKNDSKDRRIVKIAITKIGEKIVNEAVKQREIKFSKHLSNLSKEDKKELLRILRSI